MDNPLPCSVQCPVHNQFLIEKIDLDYQAEKELYCLECLSDPDYSQKIDSLKSINEFIDAASMLYYRGRKKIEQNLAMPQEYSEMISQQEDLIFDFEQRIKSEKNQRNEVINALLQKIVQLINHRADDYFRNLENELERYKSDLRFMEKWIKKQYPTLDDIHYFPSKKDIIHKITSTKIPLELLTIVKEIKEDLHDAFVLAENQEAFNIKSKRLNHITEKIQNKTYQDISVNENLEKYISSSLNLRETSYSRRSSTISSSSNKLLTAEDLMTIRNWMPKEFYNFNLKPLYKGSIHGMDSYTFHKKCDNKGPTLTILKSSGTKNIFGGFLDQSWNSLGDYISSDHAFLFSLTNQKKFSLKDNHQQYAAAGFIDQGPTFGQIIDLFLYGDFEGEPHVTYPGSYEYKIEEFSGAHNFSLEEIEVYLVVQVEIK